MRLHDFLDFWAREQGLAEFAVFGQTRLTYREAQVLSYRLANALRQAGLRQGDRVAVLSKNRLEYPLVYFAASRIGAVPVPLNYRGASAEWAATIADAGARRLLADRAVDGLIAPSEVIHFGEEFHHWIEQASADAPEVSISPECDALQLYTSGTTGQSRGAVITQRALCTNLLQIGMGAHRGTPGERSLVVTPMLHAGVVWSALAPVSWGGSLFILEEFEPGEVLRVLDEERIGYACLVPTILHTLVHEEGAAQRTYQRLRIVHTGSSAIAEATLQRAREIFRCDVVQGYGLTESTAGATTMAPGDYARRPELALSVGRPLFGTELRIVGASGFPVPVGARGEILLRGPQLLRGYWNQPDATALTLSDGWLHTGDIGRVDAEGFLFIEDRVKDMIVSGGVNVYPRMVERALESHPAVSEAAVFGIPDPHWGEKVKAVVVLRQGVDTTPAELMQYCRERLGGFQQPRVLDIVEALPRTTSGKVMKRALRDAHWVDQPRLVGAA